MNRLQPDLLRRQFAFLNAPLEARTMLMGGQFKGEDAYLLTS